MCFSICISNTPLNGQNTIDSLNKIIAHAPDELSRIKNSNYLANELLETEPERALEILEKIYPSAVAMDHPILAEVSYSIGRIYETQQQLDSALLIYNRTLEQARRFDSPDLIVNTLVQKSSINSHKNQLPEALQLAKEAYKFASEGSDKQSLIRAINTLGRTHSFMGQLDSANIFIQQAIDLQWEIDGDKRIIAELYINLGNNEGRAQRTDNAIAHFEEAQGLMQEINDSTGIANCYRAIGVEYYFSGQFPKALAYFHQAVDFLATTAYYDARIVDLDFLGETYFAIEDYANAQRYWEQAIDVWQNAHDDELNPDLIFKKGRMLFLQEKYDEALATFLQAKDVKEAAGQHIEGDWYWQIGQTYQLLENDEEATAYYQTAIERSPVENSQFTITRSLYGLGQINEKNQQREAALFYYQEAYNVAASISLKENEMDAAAGLYRLYKSKGSDTAALQYLEISKTIQDSLFNEKNVQAITRMQAGFEFEQEKQGILFEQEQENTRQQSVRQQLWMGLGFLGFLLGIGALFYRAKLKSNTRLQFLNTELVTQNEIIEQQAEKLKELDQAKSKFFTNISHEFRTPLTIISGMADIIKNKAKTLAMKESTIIKQNTLGLLNLINQILDLRKLESKNLQLSMMQGDIIEYLRYLTSSYQSYAENEGIQMHFQPVQERIIMDYDPDKMLRIVSNLLSNAIKYNRTEGHIYFEVEELASPIDDTTSLQLVVRDTGAGIPQEKLSDIFGRFYQVNEPGERKVVGSGIGLALTYELVQLMKGDIKVESEEGHGTSFTVTLPITRNANLTNPATVSITPFLEDEIIAGVAPRPEFDLTKSSAITEDLPHLLIVEDNPQIVQVLISSLENYYRLEVATNGQIGIDKAIAQVPDIIISDVMMPEKNGYELTDTLKNDERTDHIPIILLTAKSDIDSKISGLEKGADAYLAKPFEQRELLVRLDKLLELRKKLQARYANLDPGLTDSVPVIEDPFLQRLYDYVEENLSNAELNMEQLSQDIGMSRTQVFRKLKALTGKSPSPFIRSIRLQKGKQLIQTTDLTISEIAYDVGFTSLGYFSKAFIKEFGDRPSDVRG